MKEETYFKKKLPALKKLLWKEFALYIKLSNQTDTGWCECYTCNKPIRIGDRDCQAGHWLSKKTYPFHYYNEDNVKPQCCSCNEYHQGRPVEFEERLRQEYGVAHIEDMKDLRHRKANHDKAFVIDLMFHYRELNRQEIAA